MEWEERTGVRAYSADLEETVDGDVKEGIAHVDSHVHLRSRERARESAQRHVLLLLLLLLLEIHSKLIGQTATVQAPSTLRAASLYIFLMWPALPECHFTSSKFTGLGII